MRHRRQPGTPTLLRAINNRVALDLLMTEGPLTRTRLGELTGLSKVTASQMMDRLEARGLVTRAGEAAGGRGPNARLYAVNPTSAYVVGVEVNSQSDRVTAACADITGKLVGQVEQSTRDTDDPVGVVHEAVVRAAETAQTQLAKVRRVVLGTPGLVDPATGDISFVYNLPRWHAGLLASLREDLQTPVTFENDINLAAEAEAKLGAARSTRDFVLIWAGVGVGAAIVLDGRVHRGSTGAAGEIGFMPVPGADIVQEPSKRTGATGLDAGFQQLVGLAAVQTVARDHGFDGPGVEGVRAAVKAGATGQPVLQEIARRLALGVASTCLVLDPPLVVLAGHVGYAGGPALAERVQREVATITLVSPRVVTGELTEKPVLTGALQNALATVRDEVFGTTTSQ